MPGLFWYASDVSEEALPYLAIRPYPVQYEQPWTAKQGLPVLIRPIRPKTTAYARLSDNPLRTKHLHALLPCYQPESAHGSRISRPCLATSITIARWLWLSSMMIRNGQQKIIAGGRLSKSAESNEAEFAMLISDNYQRQGLGTELLKRLVQIGCDEGVDHIVAYMLPTNTGMKRISERPDSLFP